MLLGVPAELASGSSPLRGSLLPTKRLRQQSTDQGDKQQHVQKKLGSGFLCVFSSKMNYCFKSGPYKIVPPGTSRGRGSPWAIGQLCIKKAKVALEERDLTADLAVSRGSLKTGFHPRLH